MNISLKALFILFWATLANTGCYAQKQKPGTDYQIIYKAQTRGSNLEYTVDTTHIMAISKGIEGKNSKTVLKTVDKEALIALLSSIELNRINKLIPLSQEYISDRALMANVVIIINGKAYESSTFDHGNPPNELKPLIDKILALIETVE